ncbi:hypothetical protein WR25_10050 [Diploscapter pachys]|uniref:Uncharacterized protein n=1 Tax=Diploscapter pachys TaxID=2018661 RepID=A0A2A2JA80_9BILA|nr:hypothetical protein WR25_10050 [Diploscapter pachys]
MSSAAQWYRTRNEVQQKWVNGEIPVVVATIAFGMGIDKADAKKGSSDDAKDIQSKALQTGFEKMIEDCEKRREAIVRTAIQALDDNSFQTDNQQKAVDIEYNSCCLQSKTLSSYNHKAAQVVVFLFNSGMCPVQCENDYFVDQR